MRIEITERELALLSKTKARVDECAMAAKAAESCASVAAAALGDVIAHCANLEGQAEYTGFQFGKQDGKYFLDLREPEKPASPAAG